MTEAKFIVYANGWWIDEADDLHEALTKAVGMLPYTTSKITVYDKESRKTLVVQE